MPAKLWPLQPHTKGKHLVLQKYLEAWFPILGQTSSKITLIDGFAGPGEYLEGEPGSPIIALEALRKHRYLNLICASAEFIFIEPDKDSAAHLEGVVGKIAPELPAKIQFRVETRFFSDVLNELLDTRPNFGPAFVMIDPFGVSGLPMRLNARILSQPKCEVYISFMLEYVDRFRNTPEFAPNLTELYGDEDWKRVIDAEVGVERRNRLLELYKTKLKRSGAAYVLRFDLYKTSRPYYSLFFATNSLEGCDKMKQAMWKVAPFGDMAFHGAEHEQPLLSPDLFDLSPFQRTLRERFAGTEFVPIEQIEQFCKSDETSFHSGHLKKRTLTPMEKRGELEVRRPSGKKIGFTPGTTVRFRESLF